MALFLPSLAGGGAERVFAILASGFAEAGVRVDVVVAVPEGPLLDALPASARLVPLGVRRTAAATLPLARYLRRERPAGVISALSHANVVAAAAATISRKEIALVVTEHLPLTAWLPTAGLRRRAVVAGLAIAYRRATAVVAVSGGVADDVADALGIARARVHVVHNPLPVDEVARRSRETDTHPWFRDGLPPVILAVGRLTAQKDFGTLIRAFARVAAERPCRLVVLGEGEDRRALERLAASLGVSDLCDLPGFVSNPYPLIRGAAVLALSSRWEGLPTVLLEALALGTTVVATDCPSGPREILRDGELGRLVPVGDAAALAQGLASALESPSPPPPQDAIARFRVEAVVQRYAELLGLRARG